MKKTFAAIVVGILTFNSITHAEPDLEEHQKKHEELKAILKESQKKLEEAKAQRLASPTKLEEGEAQRLAKRLVVSMGYEKTMDTIDEFTNQIIGESVEAFPTESLRAIQDTMAEKLMESLISNYAKIYTVAELKGLLEFYESPLGKKVVEKESELAKQLLMDCMSIMPQLEKQFLQNKK